MLPIPEHVWARLKLRMTERRAGNVTLWLDDEGRIISADVDQIPGAADEARSRVLLRQIIAEVLAEDAHPKRRRYPDRVSAG
jgi:hypothetical protein